MIHVPFVRIFASDARQVRTCPLRPPLERAIIHALSGERIVPVAFDFVPQWPDHLGVACVAAFADVDVATCQFERCVRAHALYLLDCIFEVEEGGDFNDSTDGHNQQNANCEK